MTTILTRMIARLLFPVTLVVALAMLIKSYVSVGDGFSAGVIAATGVSIQYVAFGYRDVEKRVPWLRFAPSAAFLGLLLALTTVFVPALRGDAVLTHLPRPGNEVTHLGTVELLTAVAFDVGVFLVVVGFTVTALSMIGRVAEEESS